MSTFCPPFSYLNTPEFYSICLHIQGTVATPLHLFGAYCIIFKTPQTMISVKWALLNSHCMTFLFDAMVGFFVCPYILSPTFGAILLGVFEELGAPPNIQITAILFPTLVMFFSVIQLYENRFFLLKVEHIHWWRSVRPYWMTINYSFCILAAIPVFLAVPEDQEAAKLTIFEKLPCLPPSIRDHPSFHVIYENLNVMSITLISYCIPSNIQLTVFGRSTRLFLKENGTRMAGKTLKMQKQLLNILNIQLINLIVFLLGPLTYIASAGVFGYFNQKFINFALISFGLYGILSASLTLILHSPYRRFIFELFERVFGWRAVQNATVFVAPSVQSARLVNL